MHRLWIFWLLACLSLQAFPLTALTEKDIPILAHPSNRPSRTKGEVALCAIFRDEALYLKEWIEFHRLIGVSHFYLYNNLSQDEFWAVLKPYVEAGIVELFNVPFESSIYQDGAKTHNFVQVCCYNHALGLAKRTYPWLAIIDTDEFICPVKDKDLPTLLSRYDYAGGLVVYWQIYGTSHVWDLKPGELLVEKLLYKCPQVGGSAQFKSIVRTQFATCLDPHCCTYKLKKHAVTPNHRHFRHGMVHSQLPIDVIRINHYTYRTESFYQLVKKARRQKWGDNPSPLEEKERLDLANSTLDPVMLRFVPELHRRMIEKVKP